MFGDIPDHSLHDETRNDIVADRAAETKAAFRTTGFAMISRGPVGSGVRARRDA